MNGSLGRLLDGALDREGEIRDQDGPATPYAALRARAAEIGRELRAHNLSRDEPVHVVIGNQAADLAAMLGVWSAGGVVVPLSAGSPAATATRLAAMTAARLSVDEASVSTIAGNPPPTRRLLEGAAFIISTSGTTGAPKGVVLGHDRFVGKLEVLQALLRLTPADHAIVPLRLTFVFGLWAALLALRAGAELTLIPKFSAGAIACGLARGGTALFAVPTMLRTLLGDGIIGAAAPPRLLLSGGESLGAQLRGCVERCWHPTDLHDLYGLTETGAADFCLSSGRGDNEAGSIGWPTDGVAFQIIGHDGSACRRGEAGELRIQSAYGMLGYLDDPSLTAEAFDGAFFRTGDIARRLPSGSVELIGRTTEIVSRGGNKIAPQEIDDVFALHPDIFGALSVGVPHVHLGEALHIAVVLRQGSTCGVDTLRAWAGARIERFKVPDTIEILDALPVGATGKASRAALKAAVLARAKVKNAI